jgi:hypothetical protein
MEFGSALSLVSGCTALVALIVGPATALVVARRQFNATVISASRQKWIETLRDMLAEPIALIAAASVVRSKWKDKWDSGRGPLNAEPALLDKFERIVLTQSKIRLLLNPTEADHEQLRETIDTTIARLRSEQSLDADTQRDIQTIAALGQAILKREWQRVKIGT